MRFDNPIVDHGFIFPDIADFPGLEGERLEQDLNIDIPSMSVSISEFKKFIYGLNLNRNLSERLLNYFIFYKSFEDSRIKNSYMSGNNFEQLYIEGYTSYTLNTAKLYKNLEIEIDKLLSTADWKPPPGSYDRLFKLTEEHEKILLQSISETNIIDTANCYLARGRSLKISSSYLIVSTPTDSNWKQFLYDQTYISKTTNLHIDPKEDLLKIMIYLNEITEDSGPFSYVPKSNRWVHDTIEGIFGRAISTGSYCDSPSSREQILRLPKSLRISYNFGRTLTDDNPLQEKILQKETKMVSSMGNCFLFDPAGMHRGGICNNKNRIAIQVLLR
jgi:hypothetical protein